jgi:HPt (histidine-containing phosphotransfer) domain-containing protein/CheY-like chemotaxis protein
MNAAPGETASAAAGLVQEVLALLSAFALLEAAFAASAARVVFLAAAALAGVGLLAARGRHRLTAGLLGAGAGLLAPHYALWTQDPGIGSAAQTAWLAFALTAARLALPRRVFVVLAPVQLGALAAAVLGGPAAGSSPALAVLAFAVGATLLAAAPWRSGGPARAPAQASAPESSQAPVPTVPRDAGEAALLRGRRALVLEQGATEREALGELLRSLGLEPTLTAEAGSAVTELRRAAGEGRPYAVTIVDTAARGSAAFRARRREDDPVLAVTPQVRLWTPGVVDTDAQDPSPRVPRPATRADLLAAILHAVGGKASESRAVPAREADRVQGGRARVLVVEANPVHALVTRRLVETAGAEAVVVSRPDEGESALEALALDAVVLDPVHPECRELELRLRERHSQLTVLHAPIDPPALRSLAERVEARSPAAVSSGDGSLLDYRRLVRNLGDDESAARAVLGAFVGQADASLAALRAASTSADWPAVERLAHRLKGSLLWIAAERAARVAGTLESRARAKDAAGSRTALESLERELIGVVAAARKPR